MGIRSKLSKKFGSKKTGSDSSNPSDGTSTPHRKDIEYYKWSEIPKSKYRGKVDKAHQEKLDSYSLGDAFQNVGRRASQALSGTFSPGGTKAQSRRGSWMSRRMSGLSTPSRRGSLAEERDVRRKSVASVGKPREETVEEDEEDGTTMVNNTGISRTPTAPDSPPIKDFASDIPQITLQKTVTAKQSSPPTPFTMEELEQAMSRATMRPRRGTVLGPALQAEAVAA